jgi:hypothetical protein
MHMQREHELGRSSLHDAVLRSDVKEVKKLMKVSESQLISTINVNVNIIIYCAALCAPLALFPSINPRFGEVARCHCCNTRRSFAKNTDAARNDHNRRQGPFETALKFEYLFCRMVIIP